jgi:hypothetical protein
VSAYAAALGALRERPRHWVVTGGAGFIGSPAHCVREGLAEAARW